MHIYTHIKIFSFDIKIATFYTKVYVQFDAYLHAESKNSTLSYFKFIHEHEYLGIRRINVKHSTLAHETRSTYKIPQLKCACTAHPYIILHICTGISIK